MFKNFFLYFNNYCCFVVFLRDEEALQNFNDSHFYLRGNKLINYQQLGLKFKLYLCEVMVIIIIMIIMINRK